MDKKVLIAPSNSGLSHATRCVPIINALLLEGFHPVIASDGAALSLLEREFPDLQTKRLPSYPIRYQQATNKLKVLLNTLQIAYTIYTEKKATEKILKTDNFYGIISDNRMGVRHKNIPSVYVTHQLTILNESMPSINTKIQHKFVEKFDVCWVPDMADEPNLSGALGHPKKNNFPITYLGPLSRFYYQNLPIKYDIMVLLSGQDPERIILEEKLLREFEQSDKKIILVRGILESTPKTYSKGNITIHNYLPEKKLQYIINSSAIIISRPDYTTVMDLAKLKKKVFFIPTPGQVEQEYLAEQLTANKLAPSCKQNEFTLKKLHDLNAYKGLRSFSSYINYGKLFHFFQSK